MIVTKDMKVGLCGAGAMGAGIAQVSAQAGHEVVVYDQSKDSLDIADSRLQKTLEKLSARGKITKEGADKIYGRITWSPHLNDLGDCGLIIEAIVEREDIKKDLFVALESIVREDTILATNTSSLSVSNLGSILRCPNRFVGLHFFNPAPIMKLVEIIPSRVSDPLVISALTDLMLTWKKVPVTVKDVPGFIVNRVARPFYSEGWRALEEEVTSAATIDHIMKHIGGFRMGPLELGDLIGHDINYAAAVSIFNAYHGKTRFRPSLLQSQLVAAGQLGRKTGGGIRSENLSAEANPSQPENSYAVRDVTVSSVPSSIIQLIERKCGPAKLSESLPDGAALVNDVIIVTSRGYSANELSRQWDKPVCVIDWFNAEADLTTLAFTASGLVATETGRGLCSLLGCEAKQIEDRPGGLILRTVLQLANCAADALIDKIASADDINTAMLFGVNYPFGPLDWAKSFGFGNAIEALTHIADETGDSLYAPSEGLRRLEAVYV